MTQLETAAAVARSLAARLARTTSSKRKLSLWIVAFVLTLALRRVLKRSRKPLTSDPRQVAREVTGSGLDFDEYDIIVVGGGTAGCVLASRLSEDPSLRVILLEAGSSGVALLHSRIPVAFSLLFRGKHVHQFYTEPQQAARGRRKFWPRAKLLGGCSSINAQMAQFGAPGDWDQWGEIIKDDAWKWKNFQRYFRKMETFIPHPDFPHVDQRVKGNTGPMRIGYFSDISQGSKLFIKSAMNLGIPYNPDFNTSQGTLGVNKIMTYIDEKRKRVSSESTYLTEEVLARPNLKVVIRATVTKIITETTETGIRAVGVEFAQTKTGPRFRVSAKREVILSAGAVQSPHLLMLSGIGPSAELEKHQIPVVTDLPGVGENLVDHPVVDLYYRNKFNDSPKHVNPSTIPQVFQLISSAIQYLAYGTGAFTTNWGEVAAFVRSDDKNIFNKAELPDKLHDTTSSKSSPDLEIFTTPLAYKEHGEWHFPTHTFGIHAVLLRPKSKGVLRLNSAHPWDSPLMDPRYLVEREDVAKLVRGVRLASKLAREEPLASRLDLSDKNTLLDSDIHLKTDEELEEIIKDRVETLYHPTSTCRMAPLDELGVVDSHLRVYGVKGLRVCDASIFPEIPSGHTAGACLAVAEHLADIIKAEMDTARPSPTVVGSPGEKSPGARERFTEDRNVVIQGVSLTLPLPDDIYFRRVVREHIEPFPPVSDSPSPGPIPVVALCLPFTEEDQLRYAARHKIETKAPLSQRLAGAMLHLKQNLPQNYSRWVTIDEYTRALVLATNKTKDDLELAFDLDMLEKIRRLMGVRWIPTWNIPESDIHVPEDGNQRQDVPPEFTGWPKDLPSCPALT